MLDRIPLPKYSPSEEAVNAISHLVGVGLGLFALGWMLRSALEAPSVPKIVGIVVYALSLMLLYGVSTAYHALPVGRAKKVLRILDHCSIYLLIAGCYTPIALIVFWNTTAGKLLLAVEWGIAALGIAANAYDMTAKPTKVLSQISYLLMGWAIMLIPLPTLLEVGHRWLGWIFAGGLAYTIGIIFYLAGNKYPPMHCVWHIFVLLGSVIQMIGFMRMV